MTVMLASCFDSIVTAAAGTEHSCMVNPADAVKCQRIMTILTISGRLYMFWCFADGNLIVVTGQTGVNDIDVVKPSAFPGLVGVAVVANIATADMCRVLARCATVVVAQHALKRRAPELASDVAAGAVKECMSAG
jgi:hypothetical protein